MGRVFCVWSFNYHNDCLEGIFSSWELAEKFQNDNYLDFCLGQSIVIETPLDEARPHE
jgi:hypothetical protein